MIGNARTLAELIERCGQGRIALSFEILPGHDHHSARTAALPGALDTAAAP